MSGNLESFSDFLFILALLNSSLFRNVVLCVKSQKTLEDFETLNASCKSSKQPLVFPSPKGRIYTVCICFQQHFCQAAYTETNSEECRL